MFEAKAIRDLESALKHASQILDEPNADEEELDEVQTILGDLQQRLSNILSERRGEIRGQISSLVLEMERKKVILQRADVLEREIQGQVAFVMHLNELRQNLLSSRRRLTEKILSLRTSLEQDSIPVNAGPVSETLSLYQTLRSAQSRWDDLETERQRIENQTSHLERWIKLLRDTEQLFNALVHLPDLRTLLTREVISEIQAHLTKTRLDGLPDWEPFSEKIRSIEQDLENRRRHGNERFGEIKTGYEDFLRNLGVGDYRPRTRYTYGEDEGSYEDLYEEVRGKILDRLEDITKDINRNQTDLLKATHIHIGSDGEQDRMRQIENRLVEANKVIVRLRHALTKDLIQRGGNDLLTVAEGIQQVIQAVDTTRTDLGPILFGDHELTTEETHLLQVFRNKNDLDLTDIFVELRQAGSQMSLSTLLDIIETLYRKNRLIVRIRQRG